MSKLWPSWLSFNYIGITLVVSVFCMFVKPPPAQAAELHVSAGGWDDSTLATRFALRSPELEALRLPAWLGAPRLYIEGSVNTLRVANGYSSTLSVIGLSPVVQWQVAGSERPLYLEAGIGAALVDKTQAGPRDLSSYYHFEDIIRMSWQYSSNSESRVFIMFVHYSNGGLKSPNMGLNLAQLGWAKRF